MTVDPLTMFLEDGTGHFTRPAGGGGGSAPVMTTMAGINALATAGTLVPGTTYAVTDWTSGSGSLPGPNTLLVQAIDPSTPSGFVQVSTPLGGLGPCDGEFYWAGGVMSRLRDPLLNDVSDLLDVGTIDAFPWGEVAWRANRLDNVTFTGGFAVTSAAVTAGVTVAQNVLILAAGAIDLTGCTGGTIENNQVSGQLYITTGSTGVGVNGAQVESGALLAVPSGGGFVSGRVGGGASLNTGAFTAQGVVVDGGFFVTLTANNTNTLKNAGFSNVV